MVKGDDDERRGRYKSAFVEWLRYVRKAVGFKWQYELAEDAGITEQTMSSYANGSWDHQSPENTRKVFLSLIQGKKGTESKPGISSIPQLMKGIGLLKRHPGKEVVEELIAAVKKLRDEERTDQLEALPSQEKLERAAKRGKIEMINIAREELAPCAYTVDFTIRDGGRIGIFLDPIKYDYS